MLESGTFDLIVLDLNLPRLTGFDILDRARLRDLALPIIVLTGLTNQCEPGALNGADALFEKPPDVAALLHKIEELLHHPPAKRLSRLPSALLAVRPSTHSASLVMPGAFTSRRSLI